MKFFSSVSPIRIPNWYLIFTRFFIHAISLIWLITVFQQGISGNLEGDPVQYLLDFTGIGVLNLLLLSLSISPIAQRLKFGQIIVLRKTLGVYSAVYGLSHFAVYIAFELQFDWRLIANEIVERPYITVGFSALFILILLLATSFKSLQSKMGKSWYKLHQWVYLALLLGLLHFLWSIKANELQPYIYLCIGIFLLLLRKKKIKKFLNNT